MKKGRISKEEEAFILSNVKNMTLIDLSTKLNRDSQSVGQFIKRKLRIGTSVIEDAEFELEDREYWPELKLQFSEEELKLFKYHWSRIISQFKDDVIPTEELQVIDLIKLDLLMNRSLKQNKESIGQISELERIIQTERTRGSDNNDNVFNMERQIASLRASQESLNRDYRDLQTKKSTMLKDMKATREQRVKRLEDSKQSFVGWISYLMNNPEILKSYGVEMEKMRMSMEKQRDKLSSFHMYADGNIDQPFFTPETIKD